MEIDVRQTGPRLRRLALSTLAALILGAIAVLTVWSLMDHADRAGSFPYGAWRSLFFFTFAAAALGFAGANALLKRWPAR